MDGKLIAERKKTKGEPTQRERERERAFEREVIRATGRWTVKGGAEHSSTLEGKAISGRS